MNVDHVAFAQIRKFDGRHHRTLAAAELAQVAGRAGRYMNDGSFGVTASVTELDEDVVRRIEEHDFPKLEKIYWRNARLDFRSLDTLKQSLAEAPPLPNLSRARQADDDVSLHTLAADKEIARLATSPDSVRQLWEVCRIPDFRKVASDAHTRFLSEIYGHLQSDDGRLPTDWLAAEVDRLNRTDGDIETLTQRIAGIRIWTYVAFCNGWVADPNHWQERTRDIEDKLSDVLHERLIQRFVDRRTAHLVRRLKEDRDLLGAVRTDGEVLVEGHGVGRLSGFRFSPDHGADGADGVAAARAVERAAAQALRQEIQHRVKTLAGAPDDHFTIADPRTSAMPEILWQGTPVARLAPGRDLLHPTLSIFKSNLLDGDQERRIRDRLATWLGNHIKQLLAPLFIDTSALPSGAARGLHFRLTEHLGSMPRALVKAEIEGLDPENRRALRSHGIRIGRESVYAPALLKSKAVTLRGLLWALRENIELPLPLPADGRASVAMDKRISPGFMEIIGYRPMGPIAVRLEILERIAADAWELSKKGPFAEPASLMNLLGCGADDLGEVLKRLGYQRETKNDAVTYRPKRRQAGRTGKAAASKGTTKGKHTAPRQAVDADSPFAKLRELKISGAG